MKNFTFFLSAGLTENIFSNWFLPFQPVSLFTCTSSNSFNKAELLYVKNKVLPNNLITRFPACESPPSSL